MMCGGGDSSGCGAVNSSEYSTALGIPVAAFGTFLYFTLAVLFSFLPFQNPQVRQLGIRLAFAVITIALLVDLVYLGIQIFLLDRFCTLCILTYVVTGALFLLTFRTGKAKPWTDILSALRTREGALFLYSTAIVAAILSAAVYTSNKALANADARKVGQRLNDQAIAEFGTSPVQTLHLDGASSRGDTGAALQVVIFSDFLCPWCASTAEFFKQRMPQWKDRVRVTFMNYPLDPLCNPHQKSGQHAGSCWSALGGLCAEEQGKFWEFHDRIFDNQPQNPTGQDIMKIAFQVGIDTNVMKACMLSATMRGKVQTQIEEGQRLGVTGTPRIFINGKLLPKLSSLTAVLRSESARLGIRPLENLEE